MLSTQNSIELFLFCLFTVQGSHRDSSKQNKDLAMLTQHSSSNNLNNPSSLSASKNAAAVEAEVNRNGPYFDVAASKNVCIIPLWRFRDQFLWSDDMTLIFYLVQVTALLGKTAYLNCRVKNLGNKTVSIPTKNMDFNGVSA